VKFLTTLSYHQSFPAYRFLCPVAVEKYLVLSLVARLVLQDRWAGLSYAHGASTDV